MVNPTYRHLSKSASILLALPLLLGAPAADASVGGAGASVGAVQAGVGAATDLTRLPGNEAEDAAAVNPADPRNVVMMSTNLLGGATAAARPHQQTTPSARLARAAAAPGLSISVTHDGGATWHTRVIGIGGPLGLACCDESIAFDRYGNLFLTYLFAGRGDVPVAISTDGGDTIRPLTTIPANADQPTIATGAGAVWLTWTAQDGVITLAGAPVTGRGKVGSFGQETVPPPYNAGDYGDVAVSPSGGVIVTYQQNTDVTDGPNAVFTAIDPDGLGPAEVAAERPFVITGVGSFDFIPAQPNRSIDAETALAYDQTSGKHRGRLYAMWTGESPNESNNTDIWLRWSDDNGLHWHGSIRLNDDHTKRSQFLPKLAVDQSTGDVGACWYDARGDAGKGGLADTDGVANTDAMIYCTVSRDGGRTFAPNVRVSTKAARVSARFNAGFDYGDYAGLSFGGGVLRPAWSDNSNSAGGNPDGRLRELDLYTAAVRVR